MTQSEFNNQVISFATLGVNLVEKVNTLRRQGDPISQILEDRSMLFTNVLFALKDYDITSEILEDSEIEYLFELATIATETCP